MVAKAKASKTKSAPQKSPSSKAKKKSPSKRLGKTPVKRRQSNTSKRQSMPIRNLQALREEIDSLLVDRKIISEAKRDTSKRVDQSIRRIKAFLSVEAPEICAGNPAAYISISLEVVRLAVLFDHGKLDDDRSRDLLMVLANVTFNGETILSIGDRKRDYLTAEATGFFAAVDRYAGRGALDKVKLAISAFTARLMKRYPKGPVTVFNVVGGAEGVNDPWYSRQFVGRCNEVLRSLAIYVGDFSATPVR